MDDERERHDDDQSGRQVPDMKAEVRDDSVPARTERESDGRR